MEQFKEGDWVRDLREGMKNPIVRLKPNCVFLTNPEDYIERPIYEHWQPKEGEWCWFIDNGVPKEYIQLRQFESMDGMFFKPYGALRGYANCEPFIGELPSFIKD